MDLNKNAKVVDRVLKSVRGKNQKIKLMELLEKYQGHGWLLNDFLDTFGDDNPVLAARNCNYITTIYRKNSEFDLDPSLAKSKSGQDLKDEIHHFAKYDNPNLPVWICGTPMATHLFEVFGSDDLMNFKSPEYKSIIKKKNAGIRSSRVKDVVTSLDEVLKDPSLLSKVQSINDKTAIQYIQGLHEKISEQSETLDRMLYGSEILLDSVFDTKYTTSDLALDKGGSRNSWFKQNLGELPIYIRDIWSTLNNVDLDNKERKIYQNILTAFEASNRKVSKNAILGDYLLDLEFIMGMKDDDPIIKKYGRPDLFKYRNLFGVDSITPLDASKVINSYSIDKIREEVNSKLMEQNKGEFDKAIDRLKHLFIKDNKWEEDSLKPTSIPVKRLKNSLYWNMLSKEDFDCVKRRLQISTFSIGEDKLLNVLSMTKFKSLYEGVVEVSRKLDLMDTRVEFHKLDVIDDENVTLSKNVTNDFKKLKQLNLTLSEKFEDKYKIDIGEFLKRSKVFHPVFKKNIGAISEINYYNDYGLFVSNFDYTNVVLTAKSLVPIDSIKKEYESAKNVYSNKLTYRKGIIMPNADPGYIFQDEVGYINNLASLEPTYKKIEKKFGKRLNKIIDSVKNNDFYHGKIDGKISVLKKDPVVIAGSLCYIDPTQVENYVPVKDMAEGWVEGLEFLISFSSKDLLQKNGLVSSDSESWKNVVHRISKQRESSYINKDFVEAIDKLYSKK